MIKQNDLQIKVRKYIDNMHIIIQMQLLLLCIFMLTRVESTTVSISSQSQNVGELTTYIIIIQEHNNPNIIQTLFSDWSPNEQYPYQSDYTYYLQSGSTEQALQCKLKFSQTVIQCNLPSAPSTLSLRITNVRNPSSTKPYPVDFNLVGDTVESITGQIQVSSILQQQFVLVNYNTQLGQESASIDMYIDFDYYITSSTILKLQYDPSLTTINFSPQLFSGYSVLNSSQGTIYLHNWTDLSLGSHLLPKMHIVNAQASITYTITGLFYYEQSNNTYSIQSYAYSVTLQTIAFNAITGTQQLIMGKNAQTININTLQCAYTSNASYTQVQFSTDSIAQSTCNNQTISSNTKVCTFDNSISISDVTASISSSSSIPVNVRQYTLYHNQYYVLCEGSTTINIITQAINNTLFDHTQCSNIVGDSNLLTTLQIQVYGAQVGDTVTISSIQGILIQPWSSSSYSLQASNIINNSYVIVPLLYSNPTYVTNTNAINSIVVNRPSISLDYGQYSGRIGICEVAQAGILPSLKLQMGSSLTYQQTQYSVQVITQFSDYTSNSIMQIQFTNNEYALTNSNIGVTVNTVIKSYTINNNIMEVLSALENGVNVYNITITHVLNHVNTCPSCAITISLKTQLSQLKQYKTIQFSYSSNALTISTQPLNILTNTNLTITITNNNRNKYPNTLQSTMNLSLPFTCSSSVQNWVGNSNEYIINMNQCDIPYFNNSYNNIATLTQSIDSQRSTITTHQFTLLCEQNCMQCSTQCISCVSQAYNDNVYLYEGICFTQCPLGTFVPILSNTYTCQLCHASCQSCSVGSALTDCDTCIQHYSKSIDSICISVCGLGLYYDTDTCVQCHPNCETCINSTYCYVCIELALMVADGYCQIQDCESSCLVCQGQITNCVQCEQNLYLYESDCYAQCPDSTYPVEQLSECELITTPLLYFPVSISSFMLIFIVCICNGCKCNKNNISLLSYSSCILAYMQLVGILIITLLTNSDNVVLCYIGLSICLLSNILFTIYYCKYVHNDASIIINKMTSKSKCIYYATIALSFLFTVRTYRALYSGLFRSVSAFLIQPNNDNVDEKGDGKGRSQSQITNNPSGIFLLNQPFVIFVTVLSLIGSILFLVVAILQIVQSYYINMLYWGIDELVVVVPSILVTISDMWVSKKRGQFKVRHEQNNETLQNIKQYIQQLENTEEKIKPTNEKKKNKVKINNKLTTSTKTINNSKMKKKKVNPSFINKSKTTEHKPKQQTVQIQQKFRTIQSEQDKNAQVIKVQNKRYKQYINNLPKSEPSSEGEVPDVKQFDSVDIYVPNIKQNTKKQTINSQRNEKGKRQTISSFRRTQNNRTTLDKGRVRSRMNDIFVDVGDEEDKKTVVKGQEDRMQSSQEQEQQSQP